MTLPGMSGEDVYHELRKLSASLPVIIISGFVESDVVANLVKESNLSFLHKPFKGQTLKELASDAGKSAQNVLLN